jgi:hypothetical protein
MTLEDRRLDGEGPKQISPRESMPWKISNGPSNCDWVTTPHPFSQQVVRAWSNVPADMSIHAEIDLGRFRRL